MKSVISCNERWTVTIVGGYGHKACSSFKTTQFAIGQLRCGYLNYAWLQCLAYKHAFFDTFGVYRSDKGT